jgi:hypothetical protein
MNGSSIKTIGIEKVKVNIGMMNLTYNLFRYMFLNSPKCGDLVEEYVCMDELSVLASVEDHNTLKRDSYAEILFKCITITKESHLGKIIEILKCYWDCPIVNVR